MWNFQHRNGCRGHKSGVALYQKIDVTRNTVCLENFMLVSKTAQGWPYATRAA